MPSPRTLIDRAYQATEARKAAERAEAAALDALAHAFPPGSTPAGGKLATASYKPVQRAEVTDLKALLAYARKPGNESVLTAPRPSLPACRERGSVPGVTLTETLQLTVRKL